MSKNSVIEDMKGKQTLRPMELRLLFTITRLRVCFDGRVKFSLFEFFSLFFFLPKAFDENILGKHDITYSISN